MYTLILNRIINYKLIITGYSKTDTLTFKTNENISIVVLSLLAKIFGSSQIKIIHNMKILSSKLIQKGQSSINIGIIKISTIVRSIEKINIEINIPIITKFIILLKTKIQTSINIPLSIMATAIVGRFFKLSEYDNLTLGYLDPFTLGELDYTEV